MTYPIDSFAALAYRTAQLIRHNGKAHVLHCVKRFGVRTIRLAVGILHIKAHNVELTRRRNLRVELTYRAGSRIARICKQCLSVQLSFGVKLIEYGFRHINLAADNQMLRCIDQMHRKAAHCSEVFRNVLTGNAVAACCTTDKISVFILK